MNCNCNNINGSSAAKAKIPVVYGNVLRLAIPLTLRIVEFVDGEMQATDTDFIPSSDYPVNVVLSKVAMKKVFEAEMDGNVAFIEDKGTIPVGTYDITVTCKDDAGTPYRFKQRAVVEVTEFTAEAGILPPTEYMVKTWYLDAALFLSLKGKDGVGIFDIQIQQSDVIGGENIVTFIMTDGSQYSFSVLNGAGSVDDILNIDSPYPISNRAVTAQFDKMEQSLTNLFGDVEYNSGNKTIVFYDKGRSKVLATLDARPFIKDGMVSNVYISNNTLVITFNTDSGREAIGVPLSSVFNPNNYYNKTQVDNRIAQAVAGVQVDTSGLLSRDEFVSIADECIKPDKNAQVVLDSMGEELDGQSTRILVGMVFYIPQTKVIVKYTQQGTKSFGAPSTKLIYCNAVTNNTYRWDGTARDWVLVGGSSGGYDVTYSNGILSFNGSNQPTYSNGILTI